MTSRILSFVALVGMLGAAGCSGGGAGTAASGLTTKTPVGGTIVPAKGGSTFSMSFLVPGTGVLGTTSTGRKTAYISPGSSGIQMLFSSGAAAASYAVGTAAQPFGLSLTPGTYNVNGAGTTYGTNATTPATPGFTPAMQQTRFSLLTPVSLVRSSKFKRPRTAQRASRPLVNLLRFRALPSRA